MRNAHPRYTCYPTVVCVGKETEVTVYPRDLAWYFRDDVEYELCVFGLHDDALDYHAKIPMDHPFRIENGCMKFTHAFDKEQEYKISFAVKGGEPANLKSERSCRMYAVEEDLYELRPLKGDLHTHTYWSDGKDGISVTPADYREEGFDFFSLTDHNRMFSSELAIDLFKDVPLGLHIVKGEEVHTPGSDLHIVNAGGKTSVAHRYIHDPETYEAEVQEIAATLTHIPEQYRERMARATWACREIRKSGGIAIFPHPYWCPKRYNVTDEYEDLLFEEKIFDAFELTGGVNTMGVNLQLALWQKHLVKGNVLPAVGSSDSHNHDYSKGHFARHFTLVFARENTTEAILEAVRKDYSLACELTPNEDENIHIYGTQMRLVLFAHFLWEHYFNETWRLCLGEGILMRRYAEGEDVKAPLSALADTVENFYKKFYGLAPAPTVLPERKAFFDRVRKLQREEGPITKGSRIDLYDGGANARRD